MKHIGIIAEYNPFHNGHLYQLKKIRENFPDKKIIVIMSGNYVQRGEPAIFSSSIRTRCALIGGVDLVLELPPLFSNASSEHFSRAGLLTLANTGIIDTLCFGAENDDLETLEEIAELLIDEPDDYRAELKKNLSYGLSFPKARSNALQTIFPHKNYTDVISKPNNILAIEYLKTIKQYNLQITPVIIRRTGNDYNDIALNDNLSSASALRYTLYNTYKNKHMTNHDNNLSSIKNQLPSDIYSYLVSEKLARPVFLEDFLPFLQYKLLSEKDNLTNYYEVTEYLANKIKSLNCIPDNINDLIVLLGGKHITNARIKRCLLNIILNNTNESYNTAIKNNFVSYIRLLGFRKECSYLIKEIQDNNNLPVINKAAHAKDILSGTAKETFIHQVFIDDLYRQVFTNKYNSYIPSDYEQSVIIE